MGRFHSPFESVFGAGGSKDTAPRFTDDLIAPKACATPAAVSATFSRGSAQVVSATGAPLTSWIPTQSSKPTSRLPKGSRSGGGCQEDSGKAGRADGRGIRGLAARAGHRDAAEPPGFPKPKVVLETAGSPSTINPGQLRTAQRCRSRATASSRLERLDRPIHDAHLSSSFLLWRAQSLK